MSRNSLMYGYCNSSSSNSGSSLKKQLTLPSDVIISFLFFLLKCVYAWFSFLLRVAIAFHSTFLLFYSSLCCSFNNFPLSSILFSALFAFHTFKSHRNALFLLLFVLGRHHWHYSNLLLLLLLPPSPSPPLLLPTNTFAYVMDSICWNKFNYANTFHVFKYASATCYIFYTCIHTLIQSNSMHNVRISKLHPLFLSLSFQSSFLCSRIVLLKMNATQ